MSMFQFETIRFKNYRCFGEVDLPLEHDLTVLFAENGGGKTAVLAALAMGIAVFQPRSPRELKLDALRDARHVTAPNGKAREAAGQCVLSWKANTAPEHAVEWAVSVNPASGRRTTTTRDILRAIEAIRLPKQRWPLFAWYGTERLTSAKRRTRPSGETRDRWDGYAASLDPSISDASLLEWMEREILGDVVRHREGQPERRFDKAVTDAMVRATPGVDDAWYDPVDRSPVARFTGGHLTPWSELSDGYHVFLALVGDIARRAALLNEIDGHHAVERIEGVVLVDEIDLHLHPRWQRVVLEGLRKAFPKLQFVVTTHSPQVLSSVENRQVRRLVDWQLVGNGVHVDGRDSNAILRELMNTPDRDEEGVQALRQLHDAIDQGRREDAEHILAQLQERWGDLDPALIRAKGLMDWDR